MCQLTLLNKTSDHSKRSVDKLLGTIKDFNYMECQCPEASQCSRGRCLSCWLFLWGTWVGEGKGRVRRVKLKITVRSHVTTNASSINLPWPPFCLCRRKSNNQARTNVLSPECPVVHSGSLCWERCSLAWAAAGPEVDAGSPMPTLPWAVLSLSWGGCGSL